MSWSISLVGSPEKIAKKLDNYSEELSGQSKEEFDAALPHIMSLVAMNRNASNPPALWVMGNGHGYNPTAEGGYRTCFIEIKQLGQLA